MNLILYENDMYELQEIQQIFLSCGIHLSHQDYKELMQYQYKICELFKWVETDSFKWLEILNPILFSGYVHNENYKYICKFIIKNYYQIRIYFDLHTSDSEIYSTMVYEFNRYSGMNVKTLKERTVQILILNGGKRRNEFNEFIYRGSY